MTMHLVRGMTSLNTKKAKKAKLTLGKIAKYEERFQYEIINTNIIK